MVMGGGSRTPFLEKLIFLAPWFLFIAISLLDLFN